LKHKVLSIQLIISLLGFTPKVFAQVPYEWPIINTQLRGLLSDTIAPKINFLWNAQGYNSYCTSFAGTLYNANSNSDYNLLTPMPGTTPIPDPAYEANVLAKADTMLMMMHTIGYKAVDIVMSYPIFVSWFPHSQLFLDFYKKIYAMARQQGFKIIENCQVSLTANNPTGGDTVFLNELKNFYYNYNGVPGDTINTLQYEQSMAQMMQTIIDSLTPDYMTLEMEPETQAANMYNILNFSPDSTVKYVTYFLNNLNLHGKNVLLGAGAGNWNLLQYWENYATITSTTNPLNYLDIHIYPINGRTFNPIVFKVDSIAAKYNKIMVVGECSLHKNTDSEYVSNVPNLQALLGERDVFNYFEGIDTLFQRSMMNLSQQANIQMVNFFNSPVEFGYITWKNSYGSLTTSQISAIGSDSEYANMYNMKLGALGTWTQNAIAGLSKLNVSTGSGVSICDGNSVNLFALGNAGTGTISYNWLPGNLSGTGPNVAPAQTTTYTVTATDEGCMSIDSQKVTVNPLPNITISGNSSLPLGVTDTLTASGGISYVWTSGNTTDTAMVKPQTNTTYTVTGEGSDGCYNTATFTVTVIPLGINTITSLDKTSVYPNPGTDNLNLLFEVQGEKAAVIEVTDLSGKEIMNENATIGNGKIVTLDVSTLAQGLYFVKVVSDGNTSLVKFIKQ